MQELPSSQSIGAPLHAPFEQVSLDVHAVPSSQRSELGTNAQVPASQEPSVHGFRSSQSASERHSTQEPAVSASPAAPSAALVSPTVSLNVNAHPWARIAIDGHAVGITPLAEVQVAPGFHQATATFPDGREVVRRFEAQAPSVSLSFP